MPSEIEHQLEKIEYQIIIGDYKKGLEIIERNLNKENISDDDQLRLLNFKGHIQYRKGKYKETLKIAENILNKKKGESLSLIRLDALILKAVAYLLTNMFHSAQISLEESLLLVKEIYGFDQKEISKRKSLIHGIKGSIEGNLGNFKEGMESLELAIKYAEESGYKHNEVFFSAQQAVLYTFQDRLQEAEKLLEKALELAKSLNNKHELAFVYNRIGVLKARKFEYNEAQKYYYKSESLLIELDSTFLIAVLYNNIAALYRSTYQLDDALKYSHKALKYSLTTYVMYSNIGEIYLWQNEFENAEEALLKAKKLCLEANDIRILPNVFYNLVILAVERNETTKAKNYLKQLEDLAKTKDSEQVYILYNFALIIYYKSCIDLDKWAKAKIILNKLLEDKKLHDEYRIDALFSLLEIRLLELQSTASKESLEQVLEQIIELQNEAEDKRLYSFLVELYCLRSQVALLELNVKRSFELLTTAKTIANDKGLTILVQKIENEQKKIESQKEMWNSFQEQNAPLTETLKEVKLEDRRKNMIRDTIMEVRDKGTDTVKEYRKLFAIKI